MNTKNLSLLLSKTKRFYIQDKKGKAQLFEPNLVQRKVLKKIILTFESGKKVRLIIIKGRQQGISTLMSLMGLALSLKIPGYKTYMMTHERDLAIDIFENKIKFAWDQLPENFKGIYKVNRNNARQLLFDDEMMKSSITVGLKGRGGTFQFIHISEPGKMSTIPNIWNEMKSGLLPAGEFADAIIWESTADGGQGVFYEMVQDSLNPDSEYEVMFLFWGDSPEYRENPPESDDWVEDYKRLALRHSLSTDPMTDYNIDKEQFFWYYKKVITLQGEVKVQYPCTLEEAFSANIEGSYYQDLIDQMNAEERFGDNPEFAYNPMKPVNTHWDLAVSHDLNVAIFWQEKDGFINIFDCYANTGVGANIIARDIFAKPYIYGKFYAPWDVEMKQLDETSLRNKKDIYRSVGINFTTLGKTSVSSGIEAARALFPRIRIYRNENTIKFVNMLRAYHKKIDLTTNLAKEVHDEASHYADALRYLAVSIKINQSEYFAKNENSVANTKNLLSI